jgi:hypothetical protein
MMNEADGNQDKKKTQTPRKELKAGQMKWIKGHPVCKKKAR